jgi:hypothetical protein
MELTKDHIHCGFRISSVKSHGSTHQGVVFGYDVDHSLDKRKWNMRLLVTLAHSCVVQGFKPPIPVQ